MSQAAGGSRSIRPQRRDIAIAIVAGVALLAAAVTGWWLGLTWRSPFMRYALVSGPLAAVAFWALLVLSAPRASVPWAVVRGALAGGAAALTTHFAVTTASALALCVGRVERVPYCPDIGSALSLGLGMGLLSVGGIGPTTITLGAALGAILALALHRRVPAKAPPLAARRAT